ncbi:hypothetical protein BDA99DRAFT_531813 [Phascolomyces articulosus]|uniref:Uncharacterized protein n=1 Tax=Phascolomyces articulosus TaxID=60185 RepID=A0AAD5KNU1_9FUNG|nr:hypothetical protein BDA99DRAFT_531813 [Phascolomyces articulosus]
MMAKLFDYDIALLISVRHKEDLIVRLRSALLWQQLTTKLIESSFGGGLFNCVVVESDFNGELVIHYRNDNYAPATTVVENSSSSEPDLARAIKRPRMENQHEDINNNGNDDSENNSHQEKQHRCVIILDIRVGEQPQSKSYAEMMKETEEKRNKLIELL